MREEDQRIKDKIKIEEWDQNQQWTVWINPLEPIKTQQKLFKTIVKQWETIFVKTSIKSKYMTYDLHQIY